MPRVNRDLQRRMAARRERDRRRPSGERRYRFNTPDPALEADDEALLEEDGAVADAVEDKAPPRPARATPATSNRTASQRPAARPFSAYKDEYAYVYGDLRRVAAVIGGLLLALIILYFVLPLLVR